MKYLDKWLARVWNYAQHHHELSRLERLRTSLAASIPPSVILGRYSEVHLESPSSQLILGEHFFTRSFCQIRVGGQGKLSIGTNVFWNNYCSVTCMQEIEIGHNVMFGEGVKVYDHNHEVVRRYPLEIQRESLSYGKVIIGANTWLGSNVVVLKGVSIGPNSVIGANCLIYKDVPANSIVKSASALDIVTIDSGI